MLAVAERLASKADDKSLKGSVRQRQIEVREIKAGEVKVASAEKSLAADPADKEADLVLGKFDCLIKGNWSLGLPHLAKGSDVAIAACAARDLATSKDDVAATVCKKTGDGWWDTANAQTGVAKSQMQSRSVLVSQGCGGKSKRNR